MQSGQLRNYSPVILPGIIEEQTMLTYYRQHRSNSEPSSADETENRLQTHGQWPSGTSSVLNDCGLTKVIPSNEPIGDDIDPRA